MPTKHEIEQRPERPEIGLVNWMRIPDLLRGCPQWVLWQYRWSNSRKCWTKVPLYRSPDMPRGCRYCSASSVDPATWHTFEGVRKICDHWEVAAPGRIGIGFVLTATDPVVMLDWDDARDRDTGAIEPATAEMLRALDTYTEISPSGTGLKTLLLGKKPGDRCKGNLVPVEIYETRRFIALTGDTLQWLPQDIEGRQPQLTELYNRCFPPPPPRPPAPDMGYVPRSCPELPDDDVIASARMARNGAQFSALWAGDSSAYRSASEGDFALAFRLAFWTGGDAGRVENLMWQSGRVRDKWHRRPDYIPRTVAKAVAEQTHHYGDGRGPDRLAEELAGIDWSQVDEVPPQPTTTTTSPPPIQLPAPVPLPHPRPPIRPLDTPCETEADLARLLRLSYYDHDRYFCPYASPHMLEEYRTGNPFIIWNRCGGCCNCLHRRRDAILARVRHQLESLDRAGEFYYDFTCPLDRWPTIFKRMQRATGKALRYHRLVTTNGCYVITNADVMDRPAVTSQQVLTELDGLLAEHFRGPRIFFSSRQWEAKNLDDREKHCQYLWPLEQIPEATVHDITAAVGAYRETTIPRDPTSDTQRTDIFKRSGGWSAEQLAHFYSMMRAGELLPDSCILDYDPDDHSPAHNGGAVHGPGVASVFSPNNSG